MCRCLQAIAIAIVFTLAGSVCLGAEAYRLDVTGASYDEECLTYCLQGIANREAPRLFLDTASIFWQYPPSDQFWLKYLGEEKGFEFSQLSDLRDAIEQFRDQLGGLALYDPAEDATRYVALTLCAQRNLLPVTEAMLKHETPGPGPDCFQGMEVVEDLRGRFADDLAAYRWALDNLMPSCARKLAFSAGHSHDDTYLGGDPAITIGLDYPIAQKAFIFNLSPIERAWHRKGKPARGYPEQAKLFDEIMGALDSPAGIYGWAEPESVYCDRVSRGGNFVMCAGAPNLSFWARVPVSAPPRLPQRPARTRPLEDKFYLTFQTNEGDTPKILAGLMSGAWVSDRRGSVPIAWGINPHIAEVFPALFEFYATTATPNDTFFAGCSGAGYCFPWRMPNFDDYARHVGRCLAAHGPNVADVWESGPRLHMYERYKSLAKVDCFTQQTLGPATNNWLDDGTPVISAVRSLYYFRLDAKDPMGDMQRRIEAVAEAHEPPFFILCYGGVGPGLFKIVSEMQKRLPGDKFEVIGAQDLATLARQAGRFTVALDGLGVSPGGKVNLQLALRNPDGDAGAAGFVALELPEGWTASEDRWEHGPVPQGKALRHGITLTAGPRAGPARIRCRDSRSNTVRTARTLVYAATEIISDFSTREGWRETGASLAIEDGVGMITTPGPFATVRKEIELDFDRGPIIEISVPAVEGLWAMKVNDGTLPVDITLQKDAGLTGRHAYDLAHITGWRGKKTGELILFAIVPGKSVYVDEVKVHYTR